MTESSHFAIVPAAGRGSRLHPLTLELPKPLLEIGGRPILAHVLERLTPFAPTEIVLVIGRRDDMIPDRFGESWMGIPLSYVRQEEPLGLAHALALGAEGRTGPFLVMHGDVIYGPGVTLAPVVDGFRQGEVAATLLTEKREPGAVTRGAVQVGEAGRVSALAEYPGEAERGWGRVAAGFYVFDEVAKEALRAIPPSPAGEYEVPDALNWLLTRGHEVRAFDMEGDRVNVNAPEDLVRAEALLGAEEGPRR